MQSRVNSPDRLLGKSSVEMLLQPSREMAEHALRKSSEIRPNRPTDAQTRWRADVS